MLYLIKLELMWILVNYGLPSLMLKPTTRLKTNERVKDQIKKNQFCLAGKIEEFSPVPLVRFRKISFRSDPSIEITAQIVFSIQLQQRLNFCQLKRIAENA